MALECALLGPPRVDLSVCVGTKAGPNPWLPEGLPATPRWLEFDRVQPPPLLYLQLRGQRAEGLLHAIGQGARWPALQRWLQERPAVEALHLASLAPRGRRSLRLVLTAPRAGLEELLPQLWEGRFPTGFSGRWGDFHSHLNLGIDWEEGQPSQVLGVEFFHPGSPNQDQRWEPIFELLRERGVDPERLEAIQNWGTHPGALPDRMLQIKLGFHADGTWIPKAYLAIKGTNDRSHPRH